MHGRRGAADFFEVWFETQLGGEYRRDGGVFWKQLGGYCGG